MIGKLIAQLPGVLARFVVYRVRKPFQSEASHPAKPSGEPSAGAALVPGAPKGVMRAEAVAHGEAAILDANGKVRPYVPRGRFDWQILHEPEGSSYGDAERDEIFPMFAFAPKFVLDVGCNTGLLGAGIKKRHPDARLWGVELRPGAAKLARAHLERVIETTIENTDWRAQGVNPGDIDTVVLFDVLEHMYDPWLALLSLRSLVARDAQLLVSIPNARNAHLIEDLAAGSFRYRRFGLLDATHIRFFTLRDLMRMFYQTGFRVESRGYSLEPSMLPVYEAHHGLPFPQTIKLPSVSVTVQNEDELIEFCALQNRFTLRPAQYHELSAMERNWIDAPHPDTFAFGG